MIMQPQTHEELCNLLIQSLETKDRIALRGVLDNEEETIIKEVIDRIPVHHVRNLIIEIRNLLSTGLDPTHLKWLQQILSSKFSVISSMADGRSVLLPLISLLEDRSSPAYYMKVQALKGKLTLLRQLKESRKTEPPEFSVRIPKDRDPATHMEIDAESETDSDEDLDEENDAIEEEEAQTDEDAEENDVDKDEEQDDNLEDSDEMNDDDEALD